MAPPANPDPLHTAPHSPMGPTSAAAATLLPRPTSLPPPPSSLGRLTVVRTSLVLSLCLFLWTLGLLSSVGGWGLAGIVLLVYLGTGGSYTVYLVWHTLPRDIR